MEYLGRPNRSDVHLSREEEFKIEEETRDYFDGVAPKRHTKPQRSEYSPFYVDNLSSGGPIPELVEFQRLEADTNQKLVYNGSKASEEFVETEYYQDLNCVDKQYHHRTGTGFITMEENSNDRRSKFSLLPDECEERHASCKGNPATNDWIPSAADTVGPASDKPNRSES